MLEALYTLSRNCSNYDLEKANRLMWIDFTLIRPIGLTLVIGYCCAILLIGNGDTLSVVSAIAAASLGVWYIEPIEDALDTMNDWLADLAFNHIHSDTAIARQCEIEDT